MAAASVFSIDHGDVGDFTKGVLSWWKSHVSEVGAWSEAARIAFAMASNSAGAECAFPLLKILFGSNQNTTLSNYIRESIILLYNNTKRAHEARKVKSSQVNTLPKAKSKTRSKQNKDMHKLSSVYSERGVPLPVLTSGGE